MFIGLVSSSKNVPKNNWYSIWTESDSGIESYGVCTYYIDDKGLFMGIYSSSLYIPNFVAMEVMAVIKAIEFGWEIENLFSWKLFPSLCLIFSELYG